MADMDDIVSIGRFARLSGLSIGALRHYDELGLLEPAEVDRWTGYRRYRRAQLGRALAIARLRELDVPLEEMGVVLDAPEDLARLAALDRHRLRIEARVARGQHVLHRIRQLIDRKEPLMSRPQMPPELDPTTRRQLAAGLYNYTWTLLERDDRTAEDVDRLIHAAHASRFHWDAIGLTANRARGEWLCSRVYAVLGRAEPAVWHARRCLEILEAGGDGIEDWDRPAAYEALARAHAVAGDSKEADAWRARAREALASIGDAEDRELLEGDLATLPLD
jgi:DNA-binding transcriptional MerR regulator